MKEHSISKDEQIKIDNDDLNNLEKILMKNKESNDSVGFTARLEHILQELQKGSK